MSKMDINKREQIEAHLRALNILAADLCEQDDYERIANRILEIHRIFGLKEDTNERR